MAANPPESRRPGAPPFAAPSPLLAFALVAAAAGLFAFSTGPLEAGDTAVYARAADRLIATGFDLELVLGRASTSYPPYLYMLFLSLLALLKLVFGAQWPAALVALNVAALAGTGALLVPLAARSTGSTAAAWAALLLMLGCFELFQWSAFLLSDATFLLLSFAVFALAADRILRRQGRWAPVLALAAAAALYRPTGVVLLPAVAWAWFLARSRPGPLRKAATAAAAAAAIAGLFLFAWIMQQPERWPLTVLSRTVADTATGYAAGEIVYHRPELSHAPPASLLDFAAISADRLLHFFAFEAPGFSLPHVLINAALFIPLYALAALLAVALATGRDGFAPEQRDLLFAAAAFLMLTAWFHGLLQIDFDWRYRVPVLPHLILLASAGLAVLLRRVRPG